MLSALAVVGFYGPFGDRDATSRGQRASATEVAEAHSAARGCTKCHEAPSGDHFTADCGSCHSSARPFSDPQLTHTIFGAHVQADQPCSSCHTGKPNSEIACRECHGTKCGKDAKTAADCLECHRSGQTDEWIPR